MKKFDTIFNLFKNYKLKVFQYFCIDFLLKFINIVTAFFLMIFVDTINIGNNFIVIFIILYISVLIFSSISVLFKTLTLYLLENRVLFDFRKIILIRFLNSRYNSNSNLNKGPYLSQRIISDTELINSLFIRPIATSISSIFFLVCLIPIFLQFNFLIILLIILSAIFPSLFFSFFNKKNQYFTSKYQETLALYSSNLSDIIDSVKEIKLFNMYQKEITEINSSAENLIWINTKQMFWGFTSGQFSIALQHIIIGILLGLLGYQVQQKVITIGQAVFIYNISDNLFYVISSFWSLYFFTKNSNVPWERVKRILLRQGEDKSFKDNYPDYKIEKVKSIILKDVSVEKNNKIILRNLNFEVNLNDKVIITGHTGAGKTTILNLIVLFDRLSCGNILINGIDLYEINIKNLRSKISYFTQDSFLFNTTIKENILLDLDYNSSPVAQKYSEILKICSLETLNDNKVVGNKGIFVSGGEKQRISLARCLMKDFDVLLLDEFGNSIHEGMEIEIYKRLISFYKDKIIVAVSHRANIANLFEKKIQL
ncbi:MAG: ABC transporter ATP-binding protein/permease [Endomicrobium sp.]|jgi:ATP-binding cassette subfamily B protein|nr:ABC transporter ATP-binding protein/permease [Endomicrobium sp.]